MVTLFNGADIKAEVANLCSNGHLDRSRWAGGGGGGEGEVGGGGGVTFAKGEVSSG